jgi:hypothetical protein
MLEHSVLEDILLFRQYNKIYEYQDKGDIYLMFFTEDGESEIVVVNSDGVDYIEEADKKSFSKLLTKRVAKEA